MVLLREGPVLESHLNRMTSNKGGALADCMGHLECVSLPAGAGPWDAGWRNRAMDKAQQRETRE